MKSILLFLTISLCSFSQNIQWQWAKNVTNTLTTQGSHHLTPDGSGNFYLSIKYPLNNAIIKYDAAGNELWRVNINGSVELNGIYSTGADLVAVGTFSNNLVLGTNTLTSNGSTDIFVAKYNANGNLMWAKNYGGPSTDKGTSLCADAAGNIYFTGSFSFNIFFDSIQLTDSCNSQMFIAKLNSSGNAQLATGGRCMYSSNSSTYSHGVRIAVDAQNNIYTVGDYTYFFIDTIALTGGGGPTSIHYMAKFNPAFQVLWAETVFASGYSTINDMGIDSQNQILLTGHFHWTTGGYIPTQKYDPNGQLVWNQSYSGMCSPGAGGTAYGLAVDGADSYIIGKTTPGYGNQNCGQSLNFLIKKYSSAGVSLINDTIPVTNTYSHDIIKDSNGDYVVCGWVDGPMTLGTNTVGSNIFIAKFKEVGTVTYIKENNYKAKTFSVYPNPNTGVFTIELFSEGGILNLYDILGKKLVSLPCEKGKQSIDLKKYNKGMYLVEVITNTGKRTERISYE